MQIMQLPLIAVFLLLFVPLNDHVFCQPANHLNDLELSYDHLALSPYDKLDQHENNYDIGFFKDNEIQDIAEAIINEAARRLKKRGLSKKELSSQDKEKKNEVSKKIEWHKTSDVQSSNSDEYIIISKKDNNQIAKVKINNIDNEDASSSKDNEQVQLKSKVVTNHVNNSVKAEQRVVTTNKINTSTLDKFTFIAIIVACCVAGVAGIGLISFCWYKLRTETKDLKNGNGSMHGDKTASKNITDEEKLVHGAEVYHYLHAKKQLQQIEEPNMNSGKLSINDSSDDEDDDNEDTVYECPGLAPPRDMKVVNPLFSDTESHYSDPPSYESTPTPPLEER